MSNKDIFKCQVTGESAPTIVQLHQKRVNEYVRLTQKVKDLTVEINRLTLELVELKNSNKKLRHHKHGIEVEGKSYE